MAKKPLYFNTTTKTQLESLPDTLNRELHKEDFVTAVFSNGELTLFKVIGFERHKIDHFMDYDQLNYVQKGIVLTRTENHEFVILKRVHGTNAYSTQDQKLNEKLVLKTSKQVAFADPNFVILHYLGL